MTRDLKMPPQDLDAEQATLGCCLVDQTAAERVVAMLRPEDFYREAHRFIARAILDINARDEPVDIVTVTGELRKHGRLEDCGGAAYLTALIAEVPTSAHVLRYSLEVRRTSLLRQSIATFDQASRDAYGGVTLPEEVIGDTIVGLEAIQDRCLQANACMPVAERAPAEWAAIEARRMRPYEVALQRFGLPDLDRTTGGLEDAGLCVIMGDTNAGKSSLLRQIILSTCLEMQAAGDDGVVVLFAMEEAGWRWRLRAAGWLGTFDTSAFDNAPSWERHLRRDPGLESRYEYACVVYDQLPLWLASGDQTISSVEAACKQLSRRYRIRLVGLDYLQKLGKDEDGFGTEERAFRDVAKRLARLRDRLGCPVIGPSQISRAPDGSLITFGARAFQHEADLVIQIQRERQDDGLWSPQASLDCSKSREIRAWGRRPAHTDFATGRWHAVDETADDSRTDVSGRNAKKGGTRNPTSYRRPRRR